MRYVILFLICVIALLTGSIVYTDFYQRNKAYNSINDIGNWIVLKDSMNIDDYWRFKGEVYGAEDMTVYDFNDLDFLDPLDVNAETFEVCEGTGYARDKEHVYYPYRKIFVDYYDYPSGLVFHGPFFSKYIVKDANPMTFKYIGDGYGIDGRKLFFKGEEIPWENDIISRQLGKKRQL